MLMHKSCAKLVQNSAKVYIIYGPAVVSLGGVEIQSIGSAAPPYTPHPHRVGQGHSTTQT